MNKRIKKKINKRGGYKTWRHYRFIMRCWRYALQYGSFEWTDDNTLSCIITLRNKIEMFPIDFVVLPQGRLLTEDEVQNGVSFDLSPIKISNDSDATIINDVKNQIYDVCNAYNFKYKENDNNEEC